MNEESPTIDENEDTYDENPSDDFKVFLSRVPSTFDEDRLRLVLERHFGSSAMQNDNDVTEEQEETETNKMEAVKKVALLPKLSEEGTVEDRHKKKDEDTPEHRGCAFVTFSSTYIRDEAIKKGTIRDKASDASKRKHTIYIRPVVRKNDELEKGGDDTGNAGDVGSDQCYLYARTGKCHYGKACKFSPCKDKEWGDADGDDEPAEKKTRRKKCFAFKKKGKCKAGENCPFSHEISRQNAADEGNETEQCKRVPVSKSEKDCITWKTKGKCRKGDSCPYRHDEKLREKVLLKKAKKGNQSEKIKQPLSVRVFGLNYETTKEDVRDYFKDCGPIVELTWPTFEDSGRSKGFCGILFQSPKAVEKAIALDGQELHGRWLSVQAGKMYLRQWEENFKTGNNENNYEKRTKEPQEDVVGEFGQKVKRRKKHGFDQ